MPKLKKECKAVYTKDNLICPHCHAQYHPSEVFISKDLLGHPKNIIKDPLNKIMYTDWQEEGEPTTVEEYVCDHCGKTFVATATISYKTEPKDAETDFSDLSTSLI